jgi:hypothetical protein
MTGICYHAQLLLVEMESLELFSLAGLKLLSPYLPSSKDYRLKLPCPVYFSVDFFFYVGD